MFRGTVGGVESTDNQPAGELDEHGNWIGPRCPICATLHDFHPPGTPEAQAYCQWAQDLIVAAGGALGPAPAPPEAAP